jgi:hypothetical protein
MDCRRPAARAGHGAGLASRGKVHTSGVTAIGR